MVHTASSNWECRLHPPPKWGQQVTGRRLTAAVSDIKVAQFFLSFSVSFCEFLWVRQVCGIVAVCGGGGSQPIAVRRASRAGQSTPHHCEIAGFDSWLFLIQNPDFRYTVWKWLHFLSFYFFSQLCSFLSSGETWSVQCLVLLIYLFNFIWLQF